MLAGIAGSNPAVVWVSVCVIVVCCVVRLRSVVIVVCCVVWLRSIVIVLCCEVEVYCDCVVL